MRSSFGNNWKSPGWAACLSWALAPGSLGLSWASACGPASQPVSLCYPSGCVVFFTRWQQTAGAQQEVPRHRELHGHRLVPGMATGGPRVRQPPLPTGDRQRGGEPLIQPSQSSVGLRRSRAVVISVYAPMVSSVK